MTILDIKEMKMTLCVWIGPDRDKLSNISHQYVFLLGWCASLLPNSMFLSQQWNFEFDSMNADDIPMGEYCKKCYYDDMLHSWLSLLLMST